MADEFREEIRIACLLAKDAIRDCIRRPLGVEPDSATQALKALDALIAKAEIAPHSPGDPPICRVQPWSPNCPVVWVRDVWPVENGLPLRQAVLAARDRPGFWVAHVPDIKLKWSKYCSQLWWTHDGKLAWKTGEYSGVFPEPWESSELFDGWLDRPGFAVYANWEDEEPVLS